MNIEWIIQDSHGEHFNWVALFEAAEKNGCLAKFCTVDEIKTYHPRCTHNVSIGGEDFIVNALKNPLLIKGIFNNNSFFNYPRYKEIWNNSFLNIDYELFDVMKIPAICNPFFARPIFDNKCFSGGVFFNTKDLVSTISEHCWKCCYQPCICIATSKNIQKEWRAVIVNSKIESVSLYQEHGKRKYGSKSIPAGLYSFIEESISLIKTAPLAWVIDIALSDNLYKIVECNIFNASNFYECDRSKIVQAVSEVLDSQ